VVCVLVYSSSSSLSDCRSSSASGSVKWRDFKVVRRVGRRARTAAGRRDCRFVDRRFRRVDRSKRVVFSLGDTRRRCA
jgi:hypothetical protein